MITEQKVIEFINIFFTDTNNIELKAEYSFALVENDKKELKIVLHHSSLPFGFKVQ